MDFGSIKNQVDPHCVFTRSETGPELRVAVLVAVKIEESTKTELLSISGPLIVWLRTRPAPAPEKVSHCTLAQAWACLASIKAGLEA